MTDEHTRLAEVRSQIDEIDQQIQRLINQRAACAQEVAKIKQANGGEEEAVYYRPEREAQILSVVKERNEGPLDGEVVARLFREIMSACLALERPLTVAFLGPEGTFTQAATLKHFGHGVNAKPLTAIGEVFREVESGSSDYGLVPVENSTEGVVSHTLDLFIRSPLKICGEVELRIHHHLMSQTDDWSQLQVIYSHQQSLAQCRNWLDANLPHAEQVAVSSNAEAARLASEQPQAAAIAGETAADIYGLKLLVSNTEDEPNNTTRFLVIGRQTVPPSGRDKTSLLISAKNEPGALAKLLQPLSQHHVSLTRIESRPSRLGLWEYVFFLDLEGHAEQERVQPALEALRCQATMYKLLGSYPKAVL